MLFLYCSSFTERFALSWSSSNYPKAQALLLELRSAHHRRIQDPALATYTGSLSSVIRKAIAEGGLHQQLRIYCQEQFYTASSSSRNLVVGNISFNEAMLPIEETLRARRGLQAPFLRTFKR